MFAEVLKQLRVKHQQVSAYHAQSQGDLEKFHQTLKLLLCCYCVELGQGWEEGLPWLLLAAREVVQDSTGFSPNELVFGQTVRGPLTLLHDGVAQPEPLSDIREYVDGFCRHLYLAGEIAKKNLVTSQRKMKTLYDRKAETHRFTLGDKVLALLPIISSPFQAKFTGPFLGLRQVGNRNYLLSTPTKRKRTHVCHVNLLKLYFARVAGPADPGGKEPQEPTTPVSVAATVGCTVTFALEDDGVAPPDKSLVRGRLKN